MRSLCFVHFGHVAPYIHQLYHIQRIIDEHPVHCTFCWAYQRTIFVLQMKTNKKQKIDECGMQLHQSCYLLQSFLFSERKETERAALKHNRIVFVSKNAKNKWTFRLWQGIELNQLLLNRFEKSFCDEPNSEILQIIIFPK